MIPLLINFFYLHINISTFWLKHFLVISSIFWIRILHYRLLFYYLCICLFITTSFLSCLLWLSCILHWTIRTLFILDILLIAIDIFIFKWILLFSFTRASCRAHFADRSRCLWSHYKTQSALKFVDFFFVFGYALLQKIKRMWKYDILFF